MSNFLSLAKSQVGYWNKKTNEDLESKTANKKNGYNGYTKYGKWYGLNPAAWCAMFISWCADMADCLGSVKGRCAWVPDYITRFKATGDYFIRGSYTPAPSDLIIFGDAEHVGIVEKVEGNYVYTIEGNANGGCVASNKYYINNRYIMGYCRTRIETGTEDYEPEITIKKGTYKNGSTIEYVFSDSALTDKVGSLNRYEQCIKLGTLDDVTMVLYKIDDKNSYRMGFVEYKGS